MGTKKMGRPTDNPKKAIIKVRATESDRQKLLYCCEHSNMTQYEVVMEGLDMVYNKIRATETLDK